MKFAARPNFRLLLAAMAFLTYAVAILWLHHVQKSTWRLEQQGGLVIATSYLFYDEPYGSVDRGLWDFIHKNVVLKARAQELPADSWLARAAKKELSSGTLIATTLDGTGIGYSLFATAALFYLDLTHFLWFSVSPCLSVCRSSHFCGAFRMIASWPFRFCFWR